jgi:hypothetical protein
MQSWVKAGLQTSCFLVFTLACGGDDGPTGNPGNNTVTLTARHGHAMVYDEAHRQLLLFGGTGTEGTSPSGDRSSTWKWDGTTWTRLDATGPTPRYLVSIVYDAARQRVVLYGGQTGVFPNITVLSDTWEWDGTAWVQKATSGPSARVHQSMTFDRARGRVVLYGGFNSSTQQQLTDIWEWDGTTWRQATGSGPANSVALNVAYDEKSAALYLYSMPENGGAVTASRWNGTAVSAAPGAAPACVPIRGQLAALGSTPGGLLFYVHSCDQTGTTIQPQTWRWDGAAWSTVSGAEPTARFNAALAYDRDRNRVVLYGGEVPGGGADLADTWEFDGSAWSRR